MISRIRYTFREMWASLSRNLTLTRPPAEKPAYAQGARGMPNLNLTEVQIDALVAYLKTLE